MSDSRADRETAGSTVDLAGWVESLSRFGWGAADDAERIDQIRQLEELKGAAAAAQARLTVTFADSQRHAQQQAGVRASDVGKGIAAQVGLARRDSPVKGARHLGLAQALVFELPHTMTALSAGRINEWRATLVARETACLSRADRMAVDAELAARPGGLQALGDAALAAEARRIGYRLDPYAFTERARKAAAERCVSLRPAPETMTYLTALLPVTQGVAAYAALTKTADTARAGGEKRSRGQVMADTLVERLTGQTTATGVPLEVNLVMTDRSLLGVPDRPDQPDQPGSQEPVEVLGYGPIPAPLARQWITQTADTDADPATRVWIRRLFTSPDGTRLVDMDTRRRAFPAKLRRFIDLRDRRCRTPWCDAPIRHADHPSASPTAARPANRTAKASAKPATTPRKPPAGAPRPPPAASSRPPPRPDTPTPATHHPRSAADRWRPHHRWKPTSRSCCKAPEPERLSSGVPPRFPSPVAG